MAKSPIPQGAEYPHPQEAGSASPVKLPFEALTYNAALLAAVDRTIATDLAGARTGWTQTVHCRFLARLGRAFDWAQPKAAGIFAALVAEHGAGGNASQFRQWLEALAPKGPGRLDPAVKATALVADLE